MQTLSEIRALLDSACLAPRHRFGQNFLIDLNLMRKLTGAAELRSDDVVLEVGPGTGSLTEELLAAGAQVIAVEIDRGLATVLRARFGGDDRFSLIEGDALASKHRLNPALLASLEAASGGSGVRKLVANLPYDIATPLLLELLYVTPAFERLVCTIQKEVQERLMAPVDCDAYGPLSVIVQTLADVELIAKLPPRAFWPPPDVESAIVLIRPRRAPEIVAGIANFADFVRQHFTQRRKTLRRIAKNTSGLWKADPEQAFRSAGVSPDWRPQQLSPLAWRELHAAAQLVS